MKGLILSGGKGTRLRPITYTRAKQLVPVANKPVLFYGLEALVAPASATSASSSATPRRRFARPSATAAAWNARITYIEQDAPRGLAHAVLISETFINGDPFVMYLGDNLLNRGIDRFVEEFQREKPAAQILLTQVPDPQMFGVAELKDGRVVPARREAEGAEERPGAGRRLHVRP